MVFVLVLMEKYCFHSYFGVLLTSQKNERKLGFFQNRGPIWQHATANEDLISPPFSRLHSDSLTCPNGVAAFQRAIISTHPTASRLFSRRTARWRGRVGSEQALLSLSMHLLALPVRGSTLDVSIQAHLTSGRQRRYDPLMCGGGKSKVCGDDIHSTLGILS